MRVAEGKLSGLAGLGPSRSGSCPDPHPRQIKILTDRDPSFPHRRALPPPDLDARSSHSSHRRFGGRALAILLRFPASPSIFPSPPPISDIQRAFAHSPTSHTRRPSHDPLRILLIDSLLT